MFHQGHYFLIVLFLNTVNLQNEKPLTYFQGKLETQTYNYIREY